jgi:arylsulfatase
MSKPNILFIMCDQLRADAIAALGNRVVRTPNMDRLVGRGLTFTNAYSSCPVCVPARYTIRTGCEPYNIAIYQNMAQKPVEGQAASMEERCGSYLATTLTQLGYRTFGIGKFHSEPWDEDLGYEVQMHSEELLGPRQRKQDAYAKFIAKQHPAFSFIEQLHGERTEMYYMPQMSPLPAEITVEGWASDRAVEQINKKDDRPYFGFISFVGPHPPCAPPIPYNRMYNPDIIPNPIKGNKETDHMDEQIPWMNYLIWAEDINDSHARVLKARYYGEVSYIDQCLGKILDAVDAREDADNTVICFFSDHGDHLGDHNAWQKESFFDASAKVPFLISWPDQLEKNLYRNDLVCLTDLFGIATRAAGSAEIRDGVDILSVIKGEKAPREHLFGYHGIPGTLHFKIMVRDKEWKYIYMANGGLEQLFNMEEDPNELHQMAYKRPDITGFMRNVAIQQINSQIGLNPALDENRLRCFEFVQRPLTRIRQFDYSRGIDDFIVSE